MEISVVIMDDMTEEEREQEEVEVEKAMNAALGMAGAHQGEQIVRSEVAIKSDRMGALELLEPPDYTSPPRPPY